MSINDNIRRRAFLGTRNGEAHECIVEYEFPFSSSRPAANIQRYGDSFGTVNIVEIHWPDGIERIVPYSFRGSLINAETFNNIPNTVIFIGKAAFQYCVNMTGAISLPPNTKVVGDLAFQYTAGVTSVTFPSTPCMFGQSLFSSSIVTLIPAENTPYAFVYSSLSGSGWYNSMPSGNVYLGKNYYIYKGTMPANTNLVLEPGTLSIAGQAFQNKTQLKSITIPNTVQYIGPYAFNGCTGLTSIDIPENLNSDFYRDNYYHFINNASGGTYGEGTISYFNYSPFYSNACTGITTINYNAIDFSNPAGGNGNYNFLNSSGLPNVTTINIGNNVQRIPQYFIYNFKKVTSITLPSSVTSIGQYAFSNCTGLTSMTLSNSLTSIASYAFSGCTGLTGSFTIPETVTSLGTYILNNCSGITTLNYNAIEVPSSNPTTSISLFGTMSNLTTINIGNQVQIIPRNFLRGGQSGVSSINIPSSVTKIDYGAFYSSNLTSIDISSSVTSIGNFAFNSCSRLTSITIRSTTPPTLDATYSSTFPVTTQSYIIYVPASAVNTYKNASKWSYWASKIQAIPS